MENFAKALVAFAAFSFVVGIIVGGPMGGAILGFPAESFSRACDNLALLAIALMLMGSKGQAATPGV